MSEFGLVDTWRSLLQDKTFIGKINKVLKDYIEINDNGALIQLLYGKVLKLYYEDI